MKRYFLVAAAAAAALVLSACGGHGGSSGGGSGKHANIVLWHGFTSPGAELTAIKAMTAEFNATHPNITVTPQFAGNSDYTLQKVLAAIAGGNPPDISYLYGSWSSNISTTPALAPLTSYIAHDGSFNWKDFWQVEREVATVKGQVVGIPALVDNLALVYNKKLFAQAGLAPPTANWTWTDFANAAQTLTNAAKKQFGWAYVNDGSEDTVWRFWAMLWQAGGTILSPGNKQAAFDSPAGVNALTFLQNLSRKQSIYLDTGNGSYLGLFNSGHIGMLWTGPWDLPQIAAGHVPYGVQLLPADLNHQTISGPDNWVVFNNGAARSRAAYEFLKWFTSPAINLKWCLMTGDLPIRAATTKLPGFKQYLAKYPGVAVWVQNLNNALQARPVLATYPKISAVIGQAVQSVLLGKSSPQQALSSASQQVNGILAAPS
ncbi:MAG: ABC transporter substrate-binding protein [Actinomycetota bacterium]|nr:ABC transporter substrate-binding protein [Actinomycetota bacterium]